MISLRIYCIAQIKFPGGKYRFYKACGMENEDKRTVYADCVYRLVPKEDELSVCLTHDWIYLPSA